MLPEDAKDMVRHYPAREAAIEHAERQKVKRIIAEADFHAELFDDATGHWGLVSPTSQEYQNEQLLIGIHAFVPQPTDHANFSQVLMGYGRRVRERRGHTGFDDSDD